MRICVVCHEASLTGAPKVGFDVALFLSESHEVHLVVKTGGRLLEQPRYAELAATHRNVETHQDVCKLSYAERVDHAVGVLEEIRPDLLYVNSTLAADWCEAGALLKAAVVLHVHEGKAGLPAVFSQIAPPRCVGWVDLLVGASRAALDGVEEITGVRFENRLDFGIYVDAGAILAQSEMRADPPVNARGVSPGGGRRVVAMSGLAQPRKGPDIFFDLARRLPRYDFLWIGPWEPPDTTLNGPTVERYRSRPLDNFYVTGLTDNPYAYLRGTDVFVLTAREDPNPLVVVEALLLGKKVVAFSRTGSSRVLLDRFGYVLTGDPDSKRAAEMLPAIMEGEGGAWLSRLAHDVRSELDGRNRLSGLRDRLEDLVRRKRG